MNRRTFFGATIGLLAGAVIGSQAKRGRIGSMIAGHIYVLSDPETGINIRFVSAFPKGHPAQIFALQVIAADESSDPKRLARLALSATR